MDFLTWGLVLLGIAVVLSVTLYFRTKRSYPETSLATVRLRVASAAAPFLGLLWIVVSLVLHTIISNTIAHQSVGFSPDPYVTLPNGYVVGSLNTYSGYVRAPGASTDIPWVGPGYVRGLIDLTYDNGRFKGTYLDSHSDMQPQGTDHIRTFTFDTRDKSIRTIETNEKTDFGGQQTKVHEDATSYWQLYAKYRHAWPTAVFWIVLIGGEALIVLTLRRMEPRTPAIPGANVA